jgi:hypothetical protein
MRARARNPAAHNRMPLSPAWHRCHIIHCAELAIVDCPDTLGSVPLISTKCAICAMPSDSIGIRKVNIPKCQRHMGEKCRRLLVNAAAIHRPSLFGQIALLLVPAI